MYKFVLIRIIIFIIHIIYVAMNKNYLFYSVSTSARSFLFGPVYISAHGPETAPMSEVTHSWMGWSVQARLLKRMLDEPTLINELVNEAVELSPYGC